MSANYLAKTFHIIGLCLWAVFSLVLGQALSSVAYVYSPFSLNSSVETTIVAGLSYILAILIAIGLPWIASRKKPSLKTLGLHQLPSWTDIGLSILAVLPYFIFSAVLLYIGSELLPLIDPDVGQQISFENLSLRIEYIVAFITLVVLAPFAEELLFRGYLQGKLNESTSKWLALVLTAMIFGALHLPGFTENGVVLQWGAAADTFALGLTAGLLRMLTGSIWAGVLLHAIKNAIAYYFLFIFPSSGM